jgi:hypothetical protein
MGLGREGQERSAVLGQRMWMHWELGGLEGCRGRRCSLAITQSCWVVEIVWKV